MQMFYMYMFSTMRYDQTIFPKLSTNLYSYHSSGEYRVAHSYVVNVQWFTLDLNFCFFYNVVISHSVSPNVREKQRNPKFFLPTDLSGVLCI